MKRFILFIYCFIQMIIPAQAEIMATVNENQVNLGQSFGLVISNSDGTINSSGVDLQPLQQDFSIIGSDQQAQYTVVNGHASMSSKWVITLMPKRKGKLTIPALNIHNSSTKPLSITVEETSNSTYQTNAAEDTLLHASVDTPSPYVNQQVLYTVKLFNSRQLIDAAFQAPTIKDGLLFPLGDSRRYQTTKNQKIYNVEEQQYAIFPQKSGKIAINSPKFTALVYRDTPQQVTVQANSLELDVKVAPVSDNSWFPAKKVILSDKFNDDLNNLKQGDTIVRTITVQATGAPAQLIPELKFSKNTPDFTLYPEKAQERNQLVNGELVAHNEIKITYLLKKGGEITLPAVQLPWFDTTTKSKSLAELPAVHFAVLSKATASTAPAQPSVIKFKKNKPLSHEKNKLSFYILTIFLALLIILILIVGSRKKIIKPKKYNLNSLKQACEHNNAQQIQLELLKWAKQNWPNHHILNLTAVKDLVNDENFTQLIEEFNQFLYGRAKEKSWQPVQLWQNVRNFKRNKKNKTSKTTPSLPNLWEKF